jgi:hypothetical protein
MSDDTVQFHRGVYKVESVEARVMYVDWDVINGKVLFHGKFHTQILYVTKEHFVRERHDEVISFSNFAVIPQAAPGMTTNVSLKVHGVDWDLDQHARLTLHILTDATVTVTQSVTVYVPLLGSIQGQVMLGGVAQANAIVALYDSNMTLVAYTFTNASGYYKFYNVPPGTYTIVAAVTGNYEARTITVTGSCTTPVVANFFQAPTTTCSNILSASTCAFLNGLLGVV